MPNAGSIFLATSKVEADNIIGDTQDGLQYNNTNALTPIPLLWRGELWAVSPGGPVQFIIVVPGQEKDNLPCPTADAMPEDVSEFEHSY
jgi:hypothetical protein